jgi:PAS domain S-box-containing protein
MKTLDWSRTPLGPVDSLPQSLKTCIDFMLPAQAQIVLFWGPDYLAFYNDAYAPTIGDKHPHALGQSARTHWAEVWDSLGPLLEGVRETGKTFAARDRPFRINRHGYMEEVFFDISYSAVRDEAGGIGGVMCIVSETTARVLAAHELEASQAQLKEASERIELALGAGAVLGTWVWDVTTDTFTGDDRFARTFAQDAQALRKGLPIAQVKQSIHPDDMPVVEAAIAQAMSRGGPYRAEYRVKQEDASWLWIEANGRVELDAQGAPRRFPGVLINIDDRKRADQQRDADAAAREKAESALGDVQGHLRMAQAAGGIGVFLLDIRTNRLTVSGEFCRLFGLPPVESMDAQQVESIVEAGSVSTLSTRAQGSALLDVEYRIRRPDNGEVRWIARRAEFLRDTAGNAVSMRGVVQDITDRKDAEATLRASEAQFRILAQAVPNQVWTATAEGRLDWFNQQVFDYSGLREEELLGAGWSAMVHPEDVERVAAVWADSLRSHKPYETEFRLRRRDGAWRWHLVRALPLDADGGGVRWIGTNTDIDDQKVAQAGLAKLNAELEQRVEERALALKDAEARLRQSQKMEALGQLTGGIAHDFNNLLQGITGSLEIVKRRLAAGRADDIDRFMNSATSSAQRAASLIHRLLAFSRRQSLDTKPLDVNALVASTEDLLRRTLGEDIALNVVLASDAWPALSDENQLESAILNLAINARDAMPDGGKLTLETANMAVDAKHAAAHEGLAPGDYVTVSVTDTGSGMTPDILAKAFDPFFTTKPIGQGTGLGLSMIYGFLQQTGGYVRIESEPGDGTAVRLYLPRHHAGLAVEPAGAFTDLPQGAGEVVLVVEDDNVVRLLALDVLGELGYSTLEAADGLLALPILQSAARIDLLITDVGLPGMNGRQVAEVARQHRPDLKILFMTGYAEKATQRSEFLAPGMELIAKPFTIDELAVRIQDILRPENRPIAS